MLKENDRNSHPDAALSEVVRRLVEAYHPDRIYLFGSRARGDSGLDSDYDILIVVPDETPHQLQRSRRAYEVLRGTGIAVEVHVVRRSAFESRLTLRSSLPSIVISEGKLLYAG